MTENKRFFILKDEEFDVSPCIRDRNSKIDDIYGHYKYDDIEQICLFLNEQNDEIEMLKSKFEDCEFAHRTEMAHHRVIEKDLKKENMQLKSENQRVSEQKHIYKQDWKHLCIDKELLDSENEKLKSRVDDLKELNKIYVDFLVNEGYELADVMGKCDVE